MGLLDLVFLGEKPELKAQSAPPSETGLLSAGIKDIPIFLGLPNDQRVNFLRQYGAALWVYVCVYEIASAATEVDIKLFQSGGKPKRIGESRRNGNSTRRPSKLDPSKMEEIFDNQLLDLIERPNPYMAEGEFITALFTYLELKGDCFILLVGNKGENQAPKELYFLNPDRVQIVPHPTEYIAGYVYEVDGQLFRYYPWDIIHIKYFNPNNEYYGQSPLDAMEDTLISERNAILYNASFYKNQSVPTGILQVDHELTDDAFKRLKRQWRQAMEGVLNAHKTAILEEGMDYKILSMSQKEAEFIQSRNMNRSEILAAFGVPPVIAGLETLNYATAQIQERIFWAKTIKPKMTRVLQQLNAKLSPLFGEGLMLRGDWDSIPALQMNEEIKLRKATESFRTGLITINEARGLLGFDKISGEQAKDGLGDKLFLPMNLIPQGEDDEPPPPKKPNKPNQDTDNEDEDEDENEDNDEDKRLLLGDLYEGEIPKKW